MLVSEVTLSQLFLHSYHINVGDWRRILIWICDKNLIEASLIDFSCKINYKLNFWKPRIKSIPF